MYEAVILAAGYSSRIGTNKMLLEVDEIPIICRVIEAFYPSCRSIHVVGGHYYDDLEPILKTYEKVNIIKNNNYHLGMFSSLLCGIKDVTGDCFICPGDYPLLTSQIVEQLTTVKGEFIVPTYQGRKGHPVLLTSDLIRLLRQEPVESNLKVFRDRHQVTYIEVQNDSVLIDVDTKEAYNEVLRRKE